MRRGGTVHFDYEWERDEDEPILLSVEAEISDYHPAVIYLRNGDPGYPAEGGEVEDIVVKLPDGSRLNPIPEQLEERLVELAIQEHESGS